jgi:DNA helicase IV
MHSPRAQWIQSEPVSSDDVQLSEEQAHLDRTVEAFEQALAELTSRRSIGGIDEFANDALERMRAERIRVYSQASGPLYFGRIDRTEGGPTYIGRHAIVDRQNRLLAINWRAPAAEPFYAATPHEPRGITLRRRFDIEDGRVHGFVDEPLVRDSEDHLTEAIIDDIARQRVGEMRQIIATITPEQYDTIKEEPVPSLVVQGGPGTGKTAVGLHRAAWLLYAHPTLRAAGVLVVGPNRTFIRYIGQVLPSLGEQSVEQREIDALISKRHEEVDESSAFATLKGSGRMAVILKRLLWQRLHLPEDQRFEVSIGAMTVTATAADVVSLVMSARESSRSYQAGRLRFRARLAELIAARAIEQARGPVLVSISDVVTTVRKSKEYQRLVGKVWPHVTPERLVQALYRNRRRLKDAAGDLLSDAEIDLLLSSSAPARRIDMSATDVALFDEARWLIEPDHRTFGHVVIDEAQNLTAMELRMVVRRARRQSLTVLGDIAQRTAEAGVSTWEDVLRDAGVRTFSTRELRLSYRVPHDFLGIASGLPGIEPRIPQGVRRAPWPPVAVRARIDAVGSTTARLAERMAQDVGSVGVVAPAARMADVRAALEPVGFADASREALSPAINLLDLHVIKGLEFDAVVVVDPDAILVQRPDGGVGALYTALTRSTRALAIVHDSELPDVLSEADGLRRLDGVEPDTQWASLRREEASVPGRSEPFADSR